MLKKFILKLKSFRLELKSIKGHQFIVSGMAGDMKYKYAALKWNIELRGGGKLKKGDKVEVVGHDRKTLFVDKIRAFKKK